MLSPNPLKKPCPCGSGRKARYCCLRAEALDKKNEILSMRTYQARKKITRQLIQFSKSFDLQNSLPEAWLFFSSGAAEEPSIDILPIFMPWFYYRWDARTDEDNDGEPSPYHSLAGMYLRRQGHLLDQIERQCLESGFDAPLSFFKVVDTVPGKELTVKDLLRDDDYPELRLNDISLSRCARPGAIFLGLVFQLHGVATAEGAAPLMIPPEAMGEILALREDIKEDYQELTNEALFECEDVTLDLYWTFADRSKMLPTITNTSGEFMRLQTLYFDSDDQASVVKALVPLARDPEIISETLEQLNFAEIPDKISFKWLSSKPSKKLQGRTIYGDFTVTKDSLTVAVNSDERATRVKKEIAKRLGALVRFRMTSYLNAEKSVEIPSEPVPMNQTGQMSLSQMPEDVRKSVTAMAAAHKKKWFDTPIPMLSGQSPRDAAKTDQGRKELELLIETYTYRHEGIPDNPMASLFNPTEDEIRSELGL